MHPSDHERLAEQFSTLRSAVAGAWLTVVGIGLADAMYGTFFDVVGGACVLAGSVAVLRSFLEPTDD